MWRLRLGAVVGLIQETALSMLCCCWAWAALQWRWLEAGRPYLFIVTYAQLRSRCDVWLALKASLQTVHNVLHAASESGC
jgi:hypothetical protein